MLVREGVEKKEMGGKKMNRKEQRTENQGLTGLCLRVSSIMREGSEVLQVVEKGKCFSRLSNQEQRDQMGSV